MAGLALIVASSLASLLAACVPAASLAPLDAPRGLRRVRREPRRRHARPLAVPGAEPGRARRRRGGAAPRGVGRVVAARAAEAGGAGPGGGRACARVPRRDLRAARVRARPRAHDAGEQLGLGVLPPRPRGGMDPSRRGVLGAERADRPDQRVPADRRAGDRVPVPRDGVGAAVRGAAVPRAARDSRGGLRGRAAARLRCRPVGVLCVPARDVRDLRLRGVHGAERPRRGVARCGCGLLPPRRRSDGSGGGRVRRRARARGEADDDPRVAGADRARGARGAAHVLAGGGGGGGCVRRDRVLDVRAEPPQHGAAAGERRRPGRRHDGAVLARLAGRGSLDPLHDARPLRALAGADRDPHSRRARGRGSSVPALAGPSGRRRVWRFRSLRPR